MQIIMEIGIIIISLIEMELDYYASFTKWNKYW